MDTQLLVNTTGEGYDRLDIFEDIPITLVIQQSDLTDLTSRRVPYSKVIPLPDTSNNSRVFENYFEVNGIDFNPLNQVPCVVQYRGTDIFRGVLRLQSVITKKYERIFEIYILGDVSDFASEIRNYTLQQLDWSDLQHELNYSSVTTSWEATADSTNGLLNGDILYPLVHYGLQYQGSSTTPTFDYSFDEARSFSQSGYSVNPSVMKPSIRLKKVIDKIFERTDYNYVSDFFDTEYFQSIYMDTFQNGKLGIESASAVTNQNIFRVYTNNTNQSSPVFQQNNTLQFHALNWRTLLPDGYDPLGNFQLGTTTQIAPAAEGYFQAPYAGDYFFNLRFNYSNPNFVLGNSIFYIVANKNTSLANINIGSFFTSPQLLCDPLGGQKEADFYFSASCQTGEFIKIFILLDPDSNFGTQVKLTGYNFGGVVEANPRWELYTSPELSGQNLVDFRLGIQNVNSFDFLKSLITHFNLVVIQDEVEKQIRFEPYNWFYNDADRVQRDWTNKVDLNTDIKVEPLSFDLAKQVVWTNEQPQEDILNFDFFQANNFVFGRYKFITNDNVFTGDQEYTTGFASVPTSGLTNAPNFIIPKFYYLNNGLEVPYQTPPHLFFWNGNRYAYKDNLKTQPGYWYLTSGATPVQQSTYPCVSHLTNLDIQLPDLISDLNFQGTFDFFGNSNTQPTQFTQYTLYNLWWRDYIENIYSPETRRLSCGVFLKPVDYAELSLKDKIFIKDASFTIEKIDSADLVNWKVTPVQLIKDRLPYYKITPPAPVYALSGNTAYPPFEPVFVTNCYTSFDQDEVCNGTATIQTIFTFGSGTLQNFRKVYYDTGTQLVLVPMGTYLRQTTSTDTFVVIDIYGRILESDC
jgi:hypothetical protein